MATRQTRSRPWMLSLLSVMACAGCVAAKAPQARPPERIVTVDSERFAIADAAGTHEFVPWGFNYDRTAIERRDALLEDVLIQCPEKLDRDFAAMRRMGGNTVRVFVALSLVLRNAGEVDEEGLRRVRGLLDTAHRHGLWVILTGLANIRPSTAPEWMRQADDDTMLAAQRLFWRSLARACRDAPAVFAYDLQNEPVVHAKNSESWTDGCFNMPAGPPFCYVHRLYRRIEPRWTREIHERFASAEALRRHWPDFPRPGENWDAIAVPADEKDRRFGEFVAFHGRLLREWAGRLRDAIRSQDDQHLITVGALDPRPMAGAVDFYCLHLYPRAAASAEAWREANRTEWTRQLERLPRDKPLLIEEMYPLALAPGVTYEDYLTFFLEVTSGRAADRRPETARATDGPAGTPGAAIRPRAAGWVSFYWGEPDELPSANPLQSSLYREWLRTWSRHAP